MKCLKLKREKVLNDKAIAAGAALPGVQAVVAVNSIPVLGDVNNIISDISSVFTDVPSYAGAVPFIHSADKYPLLQELLNDSDLTGAVQ